MKIYKIVVIEYDEVVNVSEQKYLLTSVDDALKG